MAVQEGTNGNDVLQGGTENDTITGGSGNDTITDLGGDNSLNGDDGDDTITGGSGNDTIKGGAGDDTINGGSGNDLLIGYGDGTEEKDVFEHSSGDILYVLGDKNTIYYNKAQDNDYALLPSSLITTGSKIKLQGTASDYQLISNQQIAGNSSLDTEITTLNGDVIGVIADYSSSSLSLDNPLFTFVAADPTAEVPTIVGDDNNNLLNGTSEGETILGLGGNDTLQGLGGSDTLNGGTGKDKLLGGRKSDELIADEGKDKLIGGNGNDTLTGGQDSDRFIFKNPNQGIDTITDFVIDEDIIFVTGSAFEGGLQPGQELQPSQFVVGNTAVTAQQRFIYDNNNGTLLFDVDGNSSTAAIQLGTFTNLPQLTNTNILVV